MWPLTRSKQANRQATNATCKAIVRLNMQLLARAAPPPTVIINKVATMGQTQSMLLMRKWLASKCVYKMADERQKVSSRSYGRWKQEIRIERRTATIAEWTSERTAGLAILSDIKHPHPKKEITTRAYSHLDSFAAFLQHFGVVCRKMWQKKKKAKFRKKSIFMKYNGERTSLLLCYSLLVKFGTKN